MEEQGLDAKQAQELQRDGGSIPTDPEANEPAAKIQLLHILRLDPKQLLPSSPKKNSSFSLLSPQCWRFARGCQPLTVGGY